MLNGLYRKIETSGVPVVAAIEGAALGGGYELALATHHRIALDNARIMVGLPEVSLGVIPGAGGTQRLPYLIGLQAALEHIGGGRPVRIPKAKKLGMVDAAVPNREALYSAAVQWIEENPKPTSLGIRKPQWPVAPVRIRRPRCAACRCQCVMYKDCGAYPAA